VSGAAEGLGELPASADLVVDRTWDGAPLAAEERATVRFELAGGAVVVRVDAPFHGDPAPPGPPGPTPRLWEHEVVELFVAGPGDDASVPYLELELSPHGHHLALRLEGVRRVVEEGLPVDVRTEIRGGRWRGEARLPLAWLPPAPRRAAAFAAHGAGPGRRHLASVPVPGPRPDFHRPDRFPPLRLGDASGPAG